MNALVITAIVGGLAWLITRKNTQAGEALSGFIPSAPIQRYHHMKPSPKAQAAAVSDPANTDPVFQGGVYPSFDSFPNGAAPSTATQINPLQAVPSNVNTEAAVQSGPGGGGRSGRGGCDACKKCRGNYHAVYPDGSGSCMMPDTGSLIDWLQDNFPGANSAQAGAMATVAGQPVFLNGPAAGSKAVLAVRSGEPLQNIIASQGPSVTKLTASDIYSGIIGAGWQANADSWMLQGNPNVPGDTPDPNVLTLADVTLGGANMLDGIAAGMGI